MFRVVRTASKTCLPGGLLALALMGPPAFAADSPGAPIAARPVPAVGSDQPATAESLVARPSTASCKVELFAAREFQGEARQPITFAPPARCPGPWAKIVLEADFAMSAGRQFDRTGVINLAGVNLFTGTTMEPRRALAPAWHAERDVTDYAALFRVAHDGEALLTNYVDDTYTGRLTWTARLVFYAADTARPDRPALPDIVEPLTATLTTLDAAKPTVARSLTLPRNVERLMMDVMVVPQADDEFWYDCTPDRVMAKPARDAERQPCGAPFRESEIRIDGTLAGLAPIYPWIYTGGMNPAMWTIIPGIETLSLAPYRVDLTPFAALLNDGLPHRVALTIAGVRRYMFGMGTLLAWQDAGRSQVQGKLTRNTLRPTGVTVRGAMRGGADAMVGRAETAGTRTSILSGYVDTSRGRIHTRITQHMRFTNRQTQQGRGDGIVDQSTRIATSVERRTGAAVTRRTLTERFPLSFAIRRQGEGPSLSSGIVLTQALDRTESITGPGGAAYRSTHIAVTPQARSHGAEGERARPRREGSSKMVIAIHDSLSGCYERTITARDDKVVSVVDGCGSGSKR